MRTLSLFLISLALGAVAGFSCGTATPKCSVATCAGCCAADGTCQAGNTGASCGLQGGACAVCATGQSCALGSCTTVSGAGGGSTAGGSAAGGSTAGGSTAGGTVAGGTTAGGAAGGTTAGGAAGGSAGGATAGGSGLPPLMFDAGTPPEISVTFASNCNAVQPCGGDPSTGREGLWEYSGVCVEDSVFNQFISICGGATQTQVYDKVGVARGAVLFTTQQMARSVTGQVDFKVTTINNQCVNGFMGLGGCAQLPALLMNRGGITAQCALAFPDGGASTTSCTCELWFAFADQASEDYARSGNVLTTSTARTFEYCVQPQQLVYEETTPTTVMRPTRDPGVSTLRKL